MRKQAGTFLSLALLAFLGLGLEILLAFLIEPLFYGKGMDEWGTFESILHWILTCVIWGAFSFMLIRSARKKHAFDIFAFREKLRPANWLICFAALAICIVLSVIGWEGFKTAKEFQNLGLLMFVFQYVYYAFEAVLVFLIVAFGQKAGEAAFSRKNIPWGGMLAGLTWGLAHMLTKGDHMIGLLTCLGGVLYGAIYLGAKKNACVSYALILLAFVL
ncbi:MAG: hypothetical protein LBG83_04685 [Oscillospiraceae bacterium]|jgi:hypothetical protein|nr:hypothetical protein [Oscillospiraceae bacterium]